MISFRKADLIDHLRPVDHTPFRIVVKSFDDGTISLKFSENWNPQDQEDIIHYLEGEMEVEMELESGHEYEIASYDHSADTMNYLMKRIRDLINAKFGTGFDVVVGHLEISLDHHDLERYL